MSQETERRHHLLELVESIRCLKSGFEDARVEIHTRFGSIDDRLTQVEHWRTLEAVPVVKLVRRAMWVVSGASVLLALVGLMGSWIWLQDHSTLMKLSDIVIADHAVIEHNERQEQRRYIH